MKRKKEITITDRLYAAYGRREGLNILIASKTKDGAIKSFAKKHPYVKIIGVATYGLESNEVNPPPKCGLEHTSCQPTNKEWKCPICDSKNEVSNSSFVLDDSLNLECDLLHTTDKLVCNKCGLKTTGELFSRHVWINRMKQG